MCVVTAVVAATVAVRIAGVLIVAGADLLAAIVIVAAVAMPGVYV